MTAAARLPPQQRTALRASISVIMDLDKAATLLDMRAAHQTGRDAHVLRAKAESLRAETAAHWAGIDALADSRRGV